jgi:nucleoside-diphosphate-sugar epimerase
VINLTTFLITGGCGFLGSWLARFLVNEGHDVVLFDLNVNDKLLKDISRRIKIRKGSMTDPREVAEVLIEDRPEVLVHYAALLSAEAETNPKAGYEVDIASTWPLFDAARAADVDCMLFASSVAAYGPDVEGVAREDSYTMPTTIYGISKILGEMVGIWFYKTYGIQFAATRYAAVVGPGRRDGGASAYTTLAIQKPAQGEPYTVHVPETARIPIVYVKDAADATLAIYKNIRRLERRVINVGSISPTAVQLVETVRSHIPDARIDFQPLEKVARIVSSWPPYIDLGRLSMIDWRPRFSDLDLIVEDFVAEVKEKAHMFKV